MARYHVIGSNMEHICSLDCRADSDKEALAAFRAAFTPDELALNCYSDPVVINLDNPPSWHVEYAGRREWEDGHRYISGGYRYY
jgi:hypothetical protein